LSYRSARLQKLAESIAWNQFLGYLKGTPTKRQVSKRQVSKRPVSKGLKCQVYKTSGLQNVKSSKRPVAKKNIHIDSVLVVGGNPQVLLQSCLKAN
jgi:hypothetical protein